MVTTDYTSNYQRFPLGVPGRPYPMMFAGDSGNSSENVLLNVLSQRQMQLGRLEDPAHPLFIRTERPYSEMAGIAYREMPTPSMLPIFQKSLMYRDRPEARRVIFYMGEAGAGKSFMANTINDMRSHRKAVNVDCGGKDLSQLFFEPVLDISDAFQAEIDRRLMLGTLNPLSVRLLRQGLGPKAFVEENGKAAIAWGLIGEVESKPEEPSKVEDQERQLLKAQDALLRVQELEGLNKQGNSFGIKTEEGPLIRAWREGREAILDEYNKCKPTTDTSLHEFWSFLISPEKTTHTVYGGMGRSFTFDKKDMKDGFFVTLTGNTQKDGRSTIDLDGSAYSRLRPIPIGVATVDDWQHRICQLLTGVPVSTLFKSDKSRWEKNPEEFTQFLFDIRSLGLTAEQKQFIPEWQYTMLSNWEDVLRATEKLAKFYHAWNEAVTPDSPFLDSNPDIAREIDKHFAKRISVDLRMVLAHIDEAKCISPSILRVNDKGGYNTAMSWSSPPELAEAAPQPFERYFGTRLANIILDEIDNATLAEGKQHLRSYLLKLAETTGIIPPKLTEATPSKVTPATKTIADLLNMEPSQEHTAIAQAKALRDSICGWLRKRYSGLSKNNDDILMPNMVETALRQASTAARKFSTNRVTILHALNTDTAHVSREPLIQAAAFDTVWNGGKSAPTVEAGQLVDQEALLAGLAMPHIGSRNISSLWNKAFTNIGKGGAIYEYAENRAGSGLAITTIACSRKKSATETISTAMHVVRDSANMRTLIIGGPINPSLQILLAEQDITYISKSSSDACEKTQQALDTMLAGKDPAAAKLLESAFLLRNGLSDSGKEWMQAMESPERKNRSMLQKEIDEALNLEATIDDPDRAKASESIQRLAELLTDTNLTKVKRPNYIMSYRDNKIIPASTTQSR